MVQATREARPRRILGLGEYGQQEPAIVAAAVQLGEGTAFFRVKAHVHIGAVQGRLHHEAVGPQTVGQQGTAHHAARAGALALVQGSHNRTVETAGGHLITHAGHRHRRWRITGCPHGVHQPRAGPPCGSIVAGVAGLRAGLAIRCERGVNRVRIHRADIAVAQPQGLAYPQRVIGDEHIRTAQELVKHSPALRLFEVERQALLAPVREPPGIVDVTDRHPGQVFQSPVAVPAAGRFYLDHSRPEIRQYRCGCRAGNKAGAVDHQQVTEKGLLGHIGYSARGSYCGRAVTVKA